MRYLLKVLLMTTALVVPLFSLAQNHFIKIIDFDSLSQSSQQIIRQDDHYLLGFY